MGAQACSQENCGGKDCCAASKDGRLDAPSEYEPKADRQPMQEHEEPAPPHAVAQGRNRYDGDNVGDADQRGSTSSRKGVSPDEVPGGEQGESYFGRELQELRQLPPCDSQGPRDMYTFRSGATYLGQWKGNARHGVGKQTWQDGAKFIGRWEDSFADGIGKFMHADGDIFIGEWRSNAAQGLGSYYHRKGHTTYRGEWVEDLQHGHGIEEWEGGSRYCGQFVWGKKHGNGVYEWPDGSVYRGQWQANSINGYGHYIGKDGREFRGMWKGAVIHGKGKYVWPDGRSFCGQYADDQKEGFGVFTWRDGRRFDGWWEKGKQHGHGITYRTTGEEIKRGIWTRGRPPETPELVPEAANFARTAPEL